MTSTRTRRRLLVLCGGAVSALAGCASVVDRFARDEPRPETTTDRTRTDPRTTALPDGTQGTPDDVDASGMDGTGDSRDGEGAQETVTTETETTGTEATPSPTPSADLDVDPHDLLFAGASIPDDPGEHRYATIGSSEATATATVFGNWKCPYTRAFVVRQFDGIVDRFVRPGDLSIQFRALAYRSGEPFLGSDAPRAARGGLGVWNADPGSYWEYFASVFANQPRERREWATTENLLRFAAAAGVADVDRIEKDLAGDAHADAVRATSADASAVDVFSIPRIVVDGTVTAPTLDPESTVDQLERAVGR